jgi:hypothetical protein
VLDLARPPGRSRSAPQAARRPGQAARDDRLVDDFVFLSLLVGIAMGGRVILTPPGIFH